MRYNPSVLVTHIFKYIQGVPKKNRFYVIANISASTYIRLEMMQLSTECRGKRHPKFITST